MKAIARLPWTLKARFFESSPSVNRSTTRNSVMPYPVINVDQCQRQQQPAHRSVDADGEPY